MSRGHQYSVTSRAQPALAKESGSAAALGATGMPGPSDGVEHHGSVRPRGEADESLALSRKLGAPGGHRCSRRNPSSAAMAAGLRQSQQLGRPSPGQKNLL